MAVLHDARRGEQARAAGEEYGLGVAVAEGFEFAEESGEHGRDAVERQFGVNAEETFGLARCEVLFRVGAQAALEAGKLFRGQGEADSECVAAEAGEKIGAGFDGGQEREAVDRAARAIGDAILDADDDGGLGGALDNARGEDADDAAMPAFAVDDEQAIGCDLGVGREAGLDGGERGGLDVAALAVEAIELGGKIGSAMGVARGEKLDDVGGDVHAAGGVDARGEAEGDVEAGELLRGGVECGGGEERAETCANGTAQLAQAEGGDGTIFAAEGNGVGDGSDGRHLEKTRQRLLAGADGIAALEQRLRELERDGGAAEGFLRVGAAGLIGIEDSERGGNGVVDGATPHGRRPVWPKWRPGSGRQVMVGDDEVEAEAARGFRFSEGPHAGIDGDNDADALGVGRFQHARLHAVAFAQAMGNMEAHLAAEHFDGGFEQDDGYGSVHVVVAVEKYRLVRGDGAFKALDGG